jgi:hypothetical protein
MFDLPEPFGPTTTVTPGRNSSRVRSANDLNPVSFSDLRYMKRHMGGNDTAVIRPKATSRPSAARHQCRMSNTASFGSVGTSSTSTAVTSARGGPAHSQSTRASTASRGPGRTPSLGRRPGSGPSPSDRGQMPEAGRAGGSRPPGPFPRRARRRPARSRLAPLAEVGGPLGDDGTPDRAAAPPAGIALPSIHPETSEVVACPPVRQQVGEIVEARPAVADPCPQHRAHRRPDRATRTASSEPPGRRGSTPARCSTSSA